MENTGIYMWTSPSGKSYIGQAKNLDSRKNLFISDPFKYNYTSVSGLSRIDKARRKYPDFNEWRYTIIEYCSIDELNEKEVYYINYYDTFNNGYNCTEGGEGRSGATNNENQRKASSKAVIKNNKERKDKNRTLIKKYYNPNLSLKENYENIINNGVEIGKDTLYSYCKEHNITTSPNKLTDDEIKVLLDINLSVRKNLETLKDSDIKIGIKRVCKLLNELKNK